MPQGFRRGVLQYAPTIVHRNSSLRYGLRPTQRPGMMCSAPKSCVADDDIKACLGGLHVIRVASKSVVFQYGLRSPSSAKRVSRRPAGCPQDLLL